MIKGRPGESAFQDQLDNYHITATLRFVWTAKQTNEGEVTASS